MTTQSGVVNLHSGERPTMRASIVVPGGALSVEVLARPTVARGQVLVRVIASGVNPLDLKIRDGKAPHAKQPLPAVLGMDVAGVVEAVADDVATFRPGDAVYGLVGGVGGLQGSLADFVVVDADLLAHAPTNMALREAASVPLAFITAWEGLVDRARVREGQNVLVQGAGGVGRVVVQLARARGARVVVRASAARREAIEALGALAVDSAAISTEALVEMHAHGVGFDIVYDTAGGSALDASFASVRRFGHVVSCLGWGTHALGPLSFRAATYSGVFSLLPMLTGEGRAHHGEILREATHLIESGMLVASVDPRRFSLESVGDAYQAQADGSAQGKIVVDIAPD